MINALQNLEPSLCHRLSLLPFVLLGDVLVARVVVVLDGGPSAADERLPLNEGSHRTLDHQRILRHLVVTSVAGDAGPVVQVQDLAAIRGSSR